ncbi:MAG: hypothetical protein RLZZ414_245 [Bacteroidota bacterium]|jgi:hypothetical protein
MKKRLIDWKTTIAGVGLAIVQVIAASPNPSTKSLVVAGLTALLGAFSKSN